MYLFPYVFSLWFKYFWLTFFNSDVKWSHSVPNVFWKKWLADWLNTPGPSCFNTAYWIFKSMFFCNVFLSCQSTLFLKMTSAAFTIFNTAVEGNNKPPFCLKQVNLACMGYYEALNECASSASSNSSDLHSLHFSFGSKDLTMKPEI